MNNTHYWGQYIPVPAEQVNRSSNRREYISWAVSCPHRPLPALIYLSLKPTQTPLFYLEAEY